MRIFYSLATTEYCVFKYDRQLGDTDKMLMAAMSIRLASAMYALIVTKQVARSIDFDSIIHEASSPTAMALWLKVNKIRIQKSMRSGGDIEDNFLVFNDNLHNMDERLVAAMLCYCYTV